jgi:transcriptional regulator
METPKTDVPPGTLDMLLLKTLALEPMHGLGVARRLTAMTGGAFVLNAGSLFPALHGLEEQGWIRGEWGRSENNRRAKYYRLTAAGRKRLALQERQWRGTIASILRVLEAR